jgi:tetratricopeptide (TPR) repeat protein
MLTLSKRHYPLGIAAVLLSAFALFATPAAAQLGREIVTLQGDPAEREETRAQLFDELAAAESGTVARQVADHIWHFWFEAPDADSADLMREVLDRRRFLDLDTALNLLDELVKMTPDWAEAWNQRATIRFMVGDLEGSLADIDRVLPLEPKHFGALAGEAIILLKLGRKQEAQLVLRQAVEINPFLIERALLDPEPEGKDI